ncbi:MAG: hypothetical protein WBY94_30650 [Polyangiaceae bacterium]
MMLVFNPSALGDLRRIALWYRRYRLPPYEVLFFERLRATLRHVETSPTSFAIVLEDIGQPCTMSSNELLSGAGQVGEQPDDYGCGPGGDSHDGLHPLDHTARTRSTNLESTSDVVCDHAVTFKSCARMIPDRSWRGREE